MFSNVLFSPLRDLDNPAAIRRLVQVAGGSDSLTILGVCRLPSRRSRLLHSKDWLEEVVAGEEAAMTKSLQTWVKRADAEAAPLAVRSGEPAATIVEYALENGHDLVVVNTDDDHEDQVTIKRLLRDCPVPVWVMRRTQARTTRVLAAVSTEPGEEPLNAAVLDLAGSLYQAVGGELHVVHSWELFGESTMRSTSMLHTSEEDLERLLQAEQDDAKHALDALVASTEAGLPWEVHLHKGPAERVIPALISKKRINHLVVGSMARHGLSGLIVGNTAETMVDQVGCSVLVTKPPADTANGS